MKSCRLISLACAVTLLGPAASASAQLSAGERSCLNAVYVRSRKVHQREASGNRKDCIRDQSGDQDACIDSDRPASTYHAGKLVPRYNQACAPLPSFGVNASVAAIIDAAQDASDNVHRRLWGSPVDPVDDGSRCHERISDRAGDLSRVQWKAFYKCARPLNLLTGIGDVEACIATGIAAGTVQKGDDVFDFVTGGDCSDPIPSFADGDCGASPLPSVAQCIIDTVECETCAALNIVTGGAADCSAIAGVACDGVPPSPTHKCTFDEAVDNSDLDLRLQGNVSLGALASNISGAVDITCDPGTQNVNGKRVCTCDLQAWTPVTLTAIGILCIDATPCPASEIDCDGGNALGVDAVDDPDIGLCTSNADCSSQCDFFCAGLNKVQWRSGCEGFCQGGVRNDLPCICDQVGSGGCIGGTAGVDDCPGGSCVGKQNETDSDCQCQCLDTAVGGASTPGDMQCNVGVDLKVVTTLPCSNPALVDLPPVCAPFSTQAVTGFTDNANADDNTGFTIGPNSSTGSPESCANLDSSITTGFEMVSDIGFFDSALGDLRALLRLDCQ